jgi:uncharacterized protein (TIGR03437 family)
MKLTTFKASHLRYLAMAIVLCLAFSGAVDQLSAATKMGKPAKVTWSPSRLTEADFTDGVAVLSFTSSQDVEEVSIGATPSLTPYLTVEPAGIVGVVAGTAYEVIVTLDDLDEPVGHTLGGTIKVREGNRTLAKPCSVSIKSETEEEDDEGDGEEEPEGEEEGEDPEDEEEEVNTLTWVPEVIDETLFAEGEEASILFTSTKDLDKVCLWVTPSAQQYLSVEPTMISPVLGDGTEYELLLTLSGPLAEIPKEELGGTLHVRQCDESGKMRRTYDPPIGIQITPGDAEETPEADPEVVVSSANFEVGPVSPNEIVTVFGDGLGPDSKALGAKGLTVETLVNNTQVLFDGMAGPVLFTQSGQVNAIVPSSVAGQKDVTMRVIYQGKVSAPYALAIADTSPAIYSLDGSGSGPGAILNSDLTVNSRSNRAARGSWVALYGTGGGLVDDAPEDGSILTESIPLDLPVELTINGVSAQVLWAGYPAGSVLGLVQVNVMLPEDPRIVFGDWPVVLQIGDNESTDAITVAIE